MNNVNVKLAQSLRLMMANSDIKWKMKMTQDCSLLSSTADVNDVYNNKRLPKGIHIVGTGESVSKVGEIAGFEDAASAEKPEKENAARSEDECADDKIEIPSTPKNGSGSMGLYLHTAHVGGSF